MACATPRPARARSRDAGAAHARQPRGAVRIRAGDRRREPSRRDRRRSEPVLSDLRGRGAARGRRHHGASTPMPRAASRRIGRAFPTTCGRARSCSTCARRTTRPGACVARRNGSGCSSSSDRHGFAIAADECYSEIYFDEAKPAAVGAVAAAQASGRGDYRAARRLRQPVEALECARPALGLRRRRCGAGQAVPAVSHVSRRRRCRRRVAAASIAAWQDEAHVVENRAQVRAEVRRAAAAACDGARLPDAGGGVLPVGAHAGRRRGVRARALRRAERHRAAGQLHRARRARHEPGPQPHPHRAGRRTGRVRRSGRADRRVRQRRAEVARAGRALGGRSVAGRRTARRPNAVPPHARARPRIRAMARSPRLRPTARASSRRWRAAFALGRHARADRRDQHRHRADPVDDDPRPFWHPLLTCQIYGLCIAYAVNVGRAVGQAAADPLHMLGAIARGACWSASRSSIVLKGYSLELRARAAGWCSRWNIVAGVPERPADQRCCSSSSSARRARPPRCIAPRPSATCSRSRRSRPSSS